jgi:hypothetical protein
LCILAARNLKPEIDMIAWEVKNDASNMWATWTVYENGVRQGCFYHEHEAREWIKRAEFFRQRVASS